ncbi:MAG: lysophospholipid acyltransferase family protein [Rubricella sp.]
MGTAPSSPEEQRNGGILMTLAARLFTAYLRLVLKTSRFEVRDPAGIRARVMQGGRGGVFGVWHGRMLVSIFDTSSGLPVHAIASRSPDAEFALRCVEPFNIRAFRGSSANPAKPDKDKGGGAAMAAAIECLADPAAILALTPDGPGGPKGHVKHGIATIAIRAGRPVIAVGYSFRRAIIFKSWDRFLLPLPFGRAIVVWSAPIAPPAGGRGDEVEAFRRRIEQEMRRVQHEADRALGQEHAVPAPDSPEAA